MAINPFKQIEKEIKHGFNKLGDEIKGSINKIGNTIKTDVTKLGKDIEHNVTSVGNKAINEVESFGKKSINDIEMTGKNLFNDIEMTGKKTIGDIEHGGKKALDDIEEFSEKTLHKVEDAVTDEFDKLFREITKDALSKATGVLKHYERLQEHQLKDAGFELEISFLTLKWQDIGGRVTEIRKDIESIADMPPKLNKSYVIDLIKTVGPNEVCIAVNAQLAAIFVTSTDAAVGFRFVGSLPAFLEVADELLDEVGL